MYNNSVYFSHSGSLTADREVTKIEQVSTGSPVLISYADGTPFTSVNPFSIAAHIRQIIGDVKSAKPTGRGLLVRTLNNPQTDTLLCLTEFMGRPATACLDQQGIYVEAYAHAPALLNVPRKARSSRISRPRASSTSGGSDPGTRRRTRDCASGSGASLCRTSSRSALTS